MVAVVLVLRSCIGFYCNKLQFFWPILAISREIMLKYAMK